MREIKLGKYVLSWGEQTKINNEGQIKKKPLMSNYPTVERTIDELTPMMCRKIALREPLFKKATFKKNRDTFREWFEVKPVEESQKIIKSDIKLLRDFDKRSNFPYKLFQVGVCANIYGTGYLEPVFKSELTQTVDISRAPPGNDEIVNVQIVDPECITGYKTRDGKDKTKYWTYKANNLDEQYIHPDRLIPVVIDSLPFSIFGISKVHILKNILESKMDADLSAGEILNWFGHGIMDMTIQDMDDEQEKQIKGVFDKHPSFYYHDQDYALQVHNPSQINPEPFYKHLYANIAAAFEMPVHILVSFNIADAGGGSDTGVADYYHDIENIQNQVFTPIVERIYTNILESKGKKWRYYLDWNPTFVDELSEAKILQTRTYSVTQNFDRNIIDYQEARRILNDGVIYLDPNKTEPELDNVPDTVSVADPNVNPNIEPQPTVKKPTVRSLSREQIKMIEKARELGRLELVEQERRLEEAKKRKIDADKNL